MLLIEPILQVCRDVLQENLKNIVNPTKSIRITNDERVPPWAGEEFINIFGAQVGNEYPLIHVGHKDIHTMSIGITRRLRGIPTDYSAETIYTYSEEFIQRAKSSMCKRANEIINLLDGKWSIVNRISNLESLEDEEFCLMAPLEFSGSVTLIEVSPAHFYLEEDAEDSDRPAGLFLELNFAGLDTYTAK